MKTRAEVGQLRKVISGGLKGFGGKTIAPNTKVLVAIEYNTRVGEASKSTPYRYFRITLEDGTFFNAADHEIETYTAVL